MSAFQIKGWDMPEDMPWLFLAHDGDLLIEHANHDRRVEVCGEYSWWPSDRYRYATAAEIWQHQGLRAMP